MTRTLTALATAATVAAAAITMPTTADARGGRIGFGILGGLAAGAIVGGALAAPYYYGGGPYYGYGGGPYYAAAPYPIAAGTVNDFGTVSAGRCAAYASADPDSYPILNRRSGVSESLFR